MRRIIAVCFFFLCILSVSFAFADFDESQIPPPIENDKPLLSLRRTKIDRFVTGIRFDLDDENMPVIIIKEKMVKKTVFSTQ